MIRNALLIACLAFLSGEAVAQVGTAETIYHCKNGEAVREVTIARVDPASPVPCEVYDRKFRDGTPRKIYSAQFDHSYCVSKAAEYVKRLEKGFWSCEREVLIAVADSQADASVQTESAPETPSGSEQQVAGSGPVVEEVPGGPDNEKNNSISASPPDRPNSAAETGVAASESREMPAASETRTAAAAGENAKPAPAAGDDNDAIKTYLATTAEYSFAADDLGEAVFVDALDVVSRDVNGDGQAEIFVRLNHERYSAPTACPAWDLYSVSEWEFDEDTGIALEEDLAAGLGICEVVALDSRTSGYEDLLIRVNSIDGSLSVKLIKYYFGGYRVMEHHTYDGEADKTRVIRTSIEGDSSDESEPGKSGLITLFENGIPVTF